MLVIISGLLYNVGLSETPPFDGGSYIALRIFSAEAKLSARWRFGFLLYCGYFRGRRRGFYYCPAASRAR